MTPLAPAVRRAWFALLLASVVALVGAPRALLAQPAPAPSAAAPAPSAAAPAPSASTAAPSASVLAPSASTAAAAPSVPFPPSAADVALDFQVSLERLFGEIPGLRHLSGQAFLRVEVSQPAEPGASGVERRYTLRCDDAWLGRLPLGALELTAVTPAGVEATTVEFAVKGRLFRELRGRVSLVLPLDPWTATARWSPGAIGGSVRVTGLDLDQLTDAYPVLALEGRLDATLTLAGTAEDPTFELGLDARRVTYRTEPMGELALSWKHAAQRSRAALTWEAEGKRVLGASIELPLDVALHEGRLHWRTEEALALKVDAPDVDTERLRPFWVPPEGFRYRLALAAEAAGPLTALTGAARLRASVVSGTQPAETFTATLMVASERQALTLRLGRDLAYARLVASLPLTAWQAGAARAGDAPLEGEVQVALPARLTAPFLPSWVADLRGTLRSRLKLSGTLGAPGVEGTVSTPGMSATVLPIAQRLEGIEVTGKVRGGALELTRVAARAGRGTLSGAGRVALTPAGDGTLGSLLDFHLRSSLRLLARRVPVLVDGLPVGTVRGQIDVTAEASPARAKIGLTLRDTLLKLSDESFPGPATPPANPAVRVLDWLGRNQQRGSALAGPGELRLEVALATPFRVEAPGATLTLEGRLGLHRQGRVARTEGGLRLRRGGVFHLFDNPFIVQSGVVTLLGGDIEAAARAAAALGAVALHDPDAPPVAAPLDVVVDVLAEGHTVDTRVATEIRGPLRRPELLLASAPALPEYQILTLLVTGRVDAVDDRNGQVRRQVERLVSQFHNPGLKRQLFDRIGIDKVGLGFGASVSEPVLTVGRQINRQLYVESVYHHNAPPDANTREGRVELRVNPRWTVDTAFGDAAEGRAGVHYTVGFGGPPRPQVGDTLSLFGNRRRPTDSDGDGRPDTRDRCPFEAEDRDGHQDGDGCLDPDDDGDGVIDERDREPARAETRNGYRDDDGAPDEPPVPVLWLGGVVRTLRLEKGSANLTPSSRATLDVALGVLLDARDLRVEIGGHTDDRGSAITNRVIADRRARAVRDYLTGKGVPAERLTAVGYGPDRPVDRADSEEARARNRRIEMRLWR